MWPAGALQGVQAPMKPTQLWRFYLFCLLVACTLAIFASLAVTHRWSSNGNWIPPATRVAAASIKRPSKLPVIATEELGIPQPDPKPSVQVQDAVVFPDEVLLLVRVSNSLNLEESIQNLECRFGAAASSSHSWNNTAKSPVVSVKPRKKDQRMVRCGRPEVEGFPSKFLHGKVTLGIRGSDIKFHSNALYNPQGLPSWDLLVYESVSDSSDGSVILLVKGLAKKSGKELDISCLTCVFGESLPSEVLFETPVLAAAQEVIRCKKPIDHIQDKLKGLKVSVKASWMGVLPSVAYYDQDGSPRLDESLSVRDLQDTIANGDEEEDWSSPAAAEMELLSLTPEPSSMDEPPRSRRKLCACTMVWNKAQFIREWVTFHGFLGVEKFFVYDNDSDDDLERVLESLSTESYRIARRVWPWIKTQQAAFSHCAVVAKDECEWMMFMDVDEFAFPRAYFGQVGSKGSGALLRMIEEESQQVRNANGKLGQLQFYCHDFGPSGLQKTPKEGVTVGYTCRLKRSVRHKVVVLLDALSSSLLNVLHHFDLKNSYATVKITPRKAVVNHYKYQAWDAFKMKFVRRAGTYTTDWQRSENPASNDRAPGLGTTAVKPADWESRFCEVQDTGLKDFVLRSFTQPGKRRGKLTWDSHGGRLPSKRKLGGKGSDKHIA